MVLRWQGNKFYMFKSLLKISLILSLAAFFLPLFSFETSAATGFPFGGKVISVLPPLTPPFALCPCSQYVISYVNAVIPPLPILLCPTLPQTIPFVNPLPSIGSWTLGMAIPNTAMLTCPTSYLPTMWGASFF